MTTKYNIVYYMGAGASAMGIPVVADFKKVPRVLYNFIDERLRGYFINQSNVQEKINSTELGKINLIIKKFMNDFEMVSSMDTLALRIYQHYNEGNEYQEYKLFLQFIFCFQHFYKIQKKNERDDRIINHGDPRYENLIRTIGEVNDASETAKYLKVEMPKNFEFITWNYDILFENTLLTNSHKRVPNQAIIDQFLNDPDIHIPVEYNGAKLLKLNGTAFDSNINYSIYSKREIGHEEPTKYQDLFLDTLIEIYKNSFTNKSKIEFAWENDNNNKIIGNIKNIAQKQNLIIVIIGYSFPSVNRQIDKAFFEGISKSRSHSQLPIKIYIQGKDHEDSVRIERLFKQCYFSNSFDFTTIPVESGDFFFIPAEHYEFIKEQKQKVIGPVFS